MFEILESHSDQTLIEVEDENSRLQTILQLIQFYLKKIIVYRIYSINRHGRLLNFWTLRVGAYSRWALIQGWALIKFSTFSASVLR